MKQAEASSVGDVACGRHSKASVTTSRATSRARSGLSRPLSQDLALPVIPRLPSVGAVSEPDTSRLPAFPTPYSARLSTHKASQHASRVASRRTLAGLLRRSGAGRSASQRSDTHGTAGIDGDEAKMSFTAGGTTYQTPSEPISQLNVHSGSLDIWPGGALATTRNSTQSLRAPHEEAHAAARPRFLVEMEQYIRQELSTLNADDGQASRQRVQVYGEAWNALNNDFKMYRPLLSRIKHEYDAWMAKQQTMIDELFPLKNRLVTQKLEHEEALAALKADWEQQIVQLQAQLNKERATVLQQRAENRTLVQRVQSLEEQVADLERGMSEAFLARKALLAELARHEEDAELRAEERTDGGATIKRLQSQLAKTQSEHQQALMQIFEMKTQINTMVPMDDLTASRRETTRLASALDEQRAVYDALMDDHARLVEQFSEVSAAREEAVHELEHVSGTYTPRPNFSLWPTLGVSGKSTKDILMQVVQELIKSQSQVAEYHEMFPEQFKEEADSNAPLDENGVAKWFIARGTSSDVPRYLRANGKIRNRNLGKRDTELLIREVWKHKAIYESKNSLSESLENYLYIYLQKRFGIQMMIAEWGYNIYDALQRYSYDADCEIFLKVLDHELSEEVYKEQADMLAAVMKLARKLDGQSHGGKLMKKINKRDFLDLLRAGPMLLKSDGRWDALVKTLNREQPGFTINYDKLFQEDKELNQGPFIEMVRDQFLEERIEYVKEIEEAVLDASSERGMITVAGLHRVFAELDPNKSESNVRTYIMRGAGVTKYEVLDNVMEVVADKFLDRLRKGSLRRSTRRNADGTLCLDPKAALSGARKKRATLSTTPTLATSPSSLGASPTPPPAGAASPSPRSRASSRAAELQRRSGVRSELQRSASSSSVSSAGRSPGRRMRVGKEVISVTQAGARMMSQRSASMASMTSRPRSSSALLRRAPTSMSRRTDSTTPPATDRSGSVSATPSPHEGVAAFVGVGQTEERLMHAKPLPRVLSSMSVTSVASGASRQSGASSVSGNSAAADDDDALAQAVKESWNAPEADP